MKTQEIDNHDLEQFCGSIYTWFCGCPVRVVGPYRPPEILLRGHWREMRVEHVITEDL